MNSLKLDNIFRKHAVKIAYLFGSQKEAGRACLDGQNAEAVKTSDLDIGVVFERLPEDRFGIYGELYADISDVFGPFQVDLVFLQETGAMLQYEAIKGDLIYTVDGTFADDYEELVMKQAGDLAYKKVEFERDFLEALRDGYFELAR